jgi:hypothetical protein
VSGSAEAPHSEGAELHRALVACAVQPTATALDRERAVVELIALAGGRREPLDRLRLTFHGRLTHRSDDFEATQGLRLTEGALGRIPRPDGMWAWQARVRARPGRRRG